MASSAIRADPLQLIKLHINFLCTGLNQTIPEVINKKVVPGKLLLVLIKATDQPAASVKELLAIDRGWLWFLAVAFDCLQVDKALERGGKENSNRSLCRNAFFPHLWYLHRQLLLSMISYISAQTETWKPTFFTFFLLFFGQLQQSDTVILFCW